MGWCWLWVEELVKDAGEREEKVQQGEVVADSTFFPPFSSSQDSPLLWVWFYVSLLAVYHMNASKHLKKYTRLYPLAYLAMILGYDCFPPSHSYGLSLVWSPLSDKNHNFCLIWKYKQVPYFIFLRWRSRWWW